jgi:hypothetical protein
MKKAIILIFAAVLGIAGTVVAQESTVDVRDQLFISLKGGLNLSNVYDAQGEQFKADPKFGFAAGASLTVPIGKYLGVQPEILFSQKGFQGTTVILGNAYDFTRTTNYLDIPLFITLKPVESLTLLAGPQYSYLMRQKDEFTDGTTIAQQETAFENDNIRKNTLCFIGGIDINLNHIVLGARAGWDVQKNNGDGSSSTPRYKNVWYQATIGYRFINY